MTQTVLIIEDEPILARNLVASLDRIGVRAVVASTLSQGVAQVRSGKFDRACMDIRLGDGNGLDLADEIKQMEQSLPIIVMTGEDSLHHRSRAENAQVIAFLAKPFSLARFRELVSSML